MLLIPDPPVFRTQPFPYGHRRQRPDDRRFLPLPACFHPKDAEAAVIVLEGNALYDAGDLLGRGWRSGMAAVMSGDSILPRMDGLG
jgi:hypothetical protein